MFFLIQLHDYPLYTVVMGRDSSIPKIPNQPNAKCLKIDTLSLSTITIDTRKSLLISFVSLSDYFIHHHEIVVANVFGG